MKIAVDTGGWIETLRKSPLASAYAPYLRNPESVVTASVVVYEVCRQVLRADGRSAIAAVMARLQETEIVPLDEHLADRAARLGHRYNLSVADSVIYATATEGGVKLVSQDSDLKGLPGVIYIDPSGHRHER